MKKDNLRTLALSAVINDTYNKAIDDVIKTAEKKKILYLNDLIKLKKK